MPDESMQESLKLCVDELVILDTDTPMLYLGRLTSVDNFILTLEEADVHDMREATGSKEVYIHEARRNGLQKNRHRVFVRLERVISLSLLQDVVQY